VTRAVRVVALEKSIQVLEQKAMAKRVDKVNEASAAADDDAAAAAVVAVVPTCMKAQSTRRWSY
jgi:hypothetical protein